MRIPPEPRALERLTVPRIAAHLAVDPRLLLAIGPLEDHGPSLPVGTGITIASAVVDHVSAETGILRAPPFCYGVTHRAPTQRPGLASLRRKTLHRAINELMAGWEDHGIQEFILVTAHGSESHLDALLMAMTSKSLTTVFDLGSVRMDDVLVMETDDPDVTRLDTALLEYLAPEQLHNLDPAAVEEATYAPIAADGEALFGRYVQSLMTHLGFDATNEVDPEPDAERTTKEPQG